MRMRIVTQNLLRVRRGHLVGRGPQRIIERFAYHTEAGPPVQGPDIWVATGEYASSWDPTLSRGGYTAATVESVDADGTYWNASGVIVGAVADTGRRGGFSYGTRDFGAVLESQRTNLVYPSAALNSWTAVRCTVTANQSAAPDGETAGDLLTETNTNGYVAKQTDSLTDNVAYAVSAWVKKGTHTAFSIQLRDTSASTTRAQIDFVWTAGVLSVNNEDVGTGYVEVGTGGWYRAVVLVPVNTVVGANNNEVRLFATEIGAVGANRTATFWGAQIEAGTYATTYIPTTTVAVQRNADGWELNVGDMSTGAHTIYLSVVPNWNGADEDSDRYIFDSRTGTAPGCCIYHDGTSNVLLAETLPAAGAGGLGTSTTAVVRGSAYVVALVFDSNDLIFRVRDVGAETDDDATDSTVALPSSHQAIAIGRDKGDASQWDGVIRDVLIYQWRHTAAQLARNIAWLAARAA